MKKIGLLVVLVMLVIQSTLVWASNTETWQWERALQPEEGYRFNQIDLTPEIYGKSQFDLADLRVVDQDGETIPYLRAGTMIEQSEDLKITTFYLSASFQVKNEMFYDFSTELDLSSDLVVNQLLLETDEKADYFRLVEISGSFDGDHWTPIKNDSFYQVDGVVKNQISFDEPQKYTYYRLGVPDNVAPVNVTRIKGTMSSETISRNIKTLTFTIDELELNEDNHTTQLHIRGIENLPVRSISIEAEGLYNRFCKVMVSNGETEQRISSGYLYQSTLNAVPVKNELQINHRRPYQEMIIDIENEDNPPLDMKEITITYEPDRLLFEVHKEKQYTLLYGNSEVLEPSYDLERFRKEIEMQPVGSVEIGVEKEHQTTDAGAGSGMDKKWMLNVVIIAAALLVSLFAIRSLKSSSV